MRIGIITGEYLPMQGGVGAYTRILAQNLVEHQHDVFILSRVQTHEPDSRIHLTNSIKRWGLISLFTIRRWAKDKQLDVISLQFETAAYNMSGFVHFIPNILDVPVVTTFHDLYVPYLFPKAARLRNWVMIHLARASAGVIGTNSEDMVHLNRLPPATLIPIGSNILTHLPSNYDRRRWREQIEVTPEDFLIGHFGFINHTKGVEILLEDVSTIRDYYDYPMKILMIGGRTGASDPTNAAYVQKIDTLIDELGLNDIVIWTGYVDDEAVSGHMAACDIIALPYRDGASYRRGSLMAAIHHGCAIVTTEPVVDVPLFVDGENLLLSQSYVIDEDAPIFTHITPQILRLYRHPELREKLCRGARALSRHFDWSNITRRYIAFFEEITGRSS